MGDMEEGGEARGGEIETKEGREREGAMIHRRQRVAETRDDGGDGEKEAG